MQSIKDIEQKISEDVQSDLFGLDLSKIEC
jgi:hypothetical protein